MKPSRLSLALAGATLPEAGKIAVFNATAATDLSALPQDRVEVVQGFRPDHDAWAARGFSVTPEKGGPYAMAAMCLPRARAEARALVAEAAASVAPGGLIWVDGQKTDGIDTMLRDLRKRVPVSDPYSKAHGKVFHFAAPHSPAFLDWQAQPLTPAPGFVTVPGVFSAEAIDKGSAVLAKALPVQLPRRIVELGAGWGWLSAQILAHETVAELHLVEAGKAALGCARQNVTDPRAQFHWADANAFKPDRLFDGCIMNPPFHTGRAADPALGVAFVRAAARLLAPHGQLWMVANRHLPYEQTLTELFRETVEIGNDAGFKVLHANRPLARNKTVSRTRR